MQRSNYRHLQLPPDPSDILGAVSDTMGALFKATLCIARDLIGGTRITLCHIRKVSHIETRAKCAAFA
jgi:hypothetical protein